MEVFKAEEDKPLMKVQGIWFSVCIVRKQINNCTWHFQSLQIPGSY